MPTAETIPTPPDPPPGWTVRYQPDGTVVLARRFWHWWCETGWAMTRMWGCYALPLGYLLAGYHRVSATTDPVSGVTTYASAGDWRILAVLFALVGLRIGRDWYARRYRAAPNRLERPSFLFGLVPWGRLTFTDALFLYEAFEDTSAPTSSAASPAMAREITRASSLLVLSRAAQHRGHPLFAGDDPAEGAWIASVLARTTGWPVVPAQDAFIPPWAKGLIGTSAAGAESLLRRYGSANSWNPEATPQLCDTLRHDSNEHTRACAAWLLGQNASWNARPALIQALQSDSPEVRMQAATGLGHMGSPDAIPALCERLEDPDLHVVAAAVDALHRLNAVDGETREALLTAKNRSESAPGWPHVRTRMQALINRSDPAILRQLPRPAAAPDADSLSLPVTADPPVQVVAALPYPSDEQHG